MKKQLILLFLISSTLIISCKKDKDDDSPSPNPVDTSTYFFCKIDGVEWVDDAFFADYNPNGNTTRVIIQNPDDLIRIDVGSQTTGSYTFTSSGPNSCEYINGNGELFLSSSGNVTVTEYDKTRGFISGTFSGSLTNATTNETIQITEGKFNRIPLEPF